VVTNSGHDKGQKTRIHFFPDKLQLGHGLLLSGQVRKAAVPTDYVTGYGLC
jgi:hypothetical protein